MENTITRYIGLDVHKEVVQACIIDSQGKKLESHRFACNRETLGEFAKRKLCPTDQLVLEATTNTWAVADVLRGYVARLVVSNPMRTRIIASANVKTDKVDAEVLAQLLRCGYLSEVWHPDELTQRLRELTSHRAGLVRDQTRLKNRVRSLLAQRLIYPPMSTLFGKAGREWLRQLELGTADRLVIDGFLRLLDELGSEEAQIETHLAELSYPMPEMRLLMTLPGVGAAAAQSLIAALGDWRRFADGDAAASYLGLTPRVRQSAERCHYGRITKAGNSQARWLLTQAAQQVAQHPGPLGVFFRRLKAKKNHNVAVVATARKLVVIAHLMLKNNEPYRYAVPATTKQKLTTLRVTATGERRRKSGPLRKPMEPQPSGMRVHKIPTLNQVYADEGLPCARLPEELRKGEVDMLRKSMTHGHAQKVQTCQKRICRKSVRKPLIPKQT